MANTIGKSAWVFALLGTIVGQSVVLALTRRLEINLILAPVTYLFVFLSIRLAVKWSADAFALRGIAVTAASDSSRIAAKSPAMLSLHQRTLAFVSGLVLLVAYGLITLVLRASGAVGHGQSAFWYWVSLGISACIVIGTGVLVSRRPPLHMLAMDSAAVVRVVSARSWLAIATALLPIPVGVVAYLLSDEPWRLIPFVCVALVAAAVYWVLIGRAIVSLEDPARES